MAAVVEVRLCERFACLPSQLRAEDLRFLQAVAVEARYRHHFERQDQ